MTYGTETARGAAIAIAAIEVTVAVTSTTIAGSGCAKEREVQPVGSSDGAPPAAGVDARPPGGGVDAAFVPGGDDAGGPGSECDLTGDWVVAQVVFAEALGATQKTVNWFWHAVEQTGDRFTIVDSLNCGFRVTGTTTVTLPDATLEALATRNSSSVGRGGRFVPAAGGCELALDRAYNIRGADAAQYLHDHWTVGDPPVALNTFPALPDGPGMQDWDEDDRHGITLDTGLGPRYVAQRDWNEHAGTVPAGASSFGGDGVIVVTWDAQESVSDQTGVLLRTTATPQNPGRAWYARTGGAIDRGPPVLDTCKDVQRLALELFPDP